jgi:molybdopterin-guanine dinucleotide biosynthesis protein A
VSEPLAAVVLAGGASRRMGRDKATMAHPNRPGITMVEHTVGILAQRCDPVFVVAAAGQPLPELAAIVLRDEEPGRLGPLVATGRGLRAAAEAGRDRAFVAAVDMPDLAPELIDLLALPADADVVLPWDGRDHYLAAVYRTDLADRIAALMVTGARSMRALTDAVSAHRVELPPSSWLTNLNRPADLG